MYLPVDLEKKLPSKESDISGLVYYPKKIDFGVIWNEGIYCVPLVLTMRVGLNYSYYIDLLRLKHNYIEVSDVWFFKY
jgi:hypothetical protein